MTESLVIKPNSSAVVKIMAFSIVFQLPVIVWYGDGFLAKAIFNDIPALLALFLAASFRVNTFQVQRVLNTNWSVSYFCVCLSVFFFSFMISWLLSGLLLD